MADESSICIKRTINLGVYRLNKLCMYIMYVHRNEMIYIACSAGPIWAVLYYQAQRSYLLAQENWYIENAIFSSSNEHIGGEREK